MLRLNIFFILVVVALKKSDAVCNVCNTNGVACNSKNTFHLCYENSPNTTATYSCPNPSHICTKYGFICEDPDVVDIKPACGDTSLCGVCTGIPNGDFTCTSRTTMTMCIDETLTNQRGSCPKGYLCDPRKSNSPCVRSCFVDESALCDLGSPIDVPEIPSTTVIFSPTPETSSTLATAPVDSEPITSTESEPIPSTESEPITSTESTSATPEPTTSTSTTVTSTNSPPVTQSPSAAICNEQQSAGRFPYIDESNCEGYVYCFWKSGTLHSNTLLCPNGRYFNKNTTTCADVKPVWCL